VSASAAHAPQPIGSQCAPADSSRGRDSTCVSLPCLPCPVSCNFGFVLTVVFGIHAALDLVGRCIPRTESHAVFPLKDNDPFGLPILLVTLEPRRSFLLLKRRGELRSIIGDRLDILVANAGVSKAATIEEMTVEDFDKLFAVNVRAPYFLVQQLLPVLGDGSSVILVSSLGAHAAVGTLSAYAATKGAIDTLVKYFAAALGPRGIRVNAVAPGVINTDMSNLVKTDEGKSFVLGIQALKRIGQPDDVGSVVAFLASQDARWITGDTIRVDGGSKL
jgi:3-oxoacyl-[acyl-carrier protein] reductase